MRSAMSEPSSVAAKKVSATHKQQMAGADNRAKEEEASTREVVCEAHTGALS